jgi:hypothetical protein
MATDCAPPTALVLMLSACAENLRLLLMDGGGDFSLRKPLDRRMNVLDRRTGFSRRLYLSAAAWMRSRIVRAAFSRPRDMFVRSR